MSTNYTDPWIRCDDDGVAVRGYYFPWGTKHIRYRDIRAARVVQLGAFSGRGRIWGTANPKYWASLDPRRPRKRVGIVLDVGARVQPLLTPDDPASFDAAIRAHTDLPPDSAEPGRARVV